MVQSIGRVLALAIVVATSGACGGGGGGGGVAGSGALQVTYNLVRITYYSPVWQAGGTVQATATISPLPATTPYVFVVDSGNVLVPGSVNVVANTNGTFTAHLPLRGDLTAAVYTGTFTLKLCKDVACATPYTLQGAALPYTITITPQVTTTATADLLVDGVSQVGTGGATDANGVRNYSVSMPTGSVLEVDTSVPIVDWSADSGPSGATVAYTSVTPPKTSTRISLTVPADASETTTLSELAADGQMFYVHVTVTH